MSILRALIAAAVLFVVALAAPASAGGPTSAILSVPGEGRTASLYYTDDEYGQLARLIGAEGMSVPGATDTGQSHESGTPVNVTWLIHDVEPWRIDRIYLNADGGPWIATQAMDPETGSIWDSPVLWHQPTSGKELSMLLDELGVGSAAPAEDAAATAPQVETPAPTPAPAAAEPADSATGGVWWGLGGLVLGAALAVGFLRLRHSREDEPELEAGADWLAPQTRSTSA